MTRQPGCRTPRAQVPDHGAVAAGTSRAAGDWGTGSKGRKWAEEAEADSVHVILFMPKEGAAHGKKGQHAGKGQMASDFGCPCMETAISG